MIGTSIGKVLSSWATPKLSSYMETSLVTRRCLNFMLLAVMLLCCRLVSVVNLSPLEVRWQVLWTPVPSVCLMSCVRLWSCGNLFLSLSVSLRLLPMHGSEESYMGFAHNVIMWQVKCSSKWKRYGLADGSVGGLSWLPVSLVVFPCWTSHLSLILWLSDRFFLLLWTWLAMNLTNWVCPWMSTHACLSSHSLPRWCFPWMK